jgi:hypothetical protein
MAGPLEDDREVRQVLRYWLGALRFEEALGSRPRAYRPETAERATDRRFPDAGSSQPYFRLGGEHAGFWTSTEGDAVAAMDAAVQRFLRHWLRRNTGAAGRASRDDADAPQGAWIAGWPAVHFERRDEIATLFRFPVTIEWRRAGAPLELVDPVTRRALGRESPDAVRVRAAASGDGDPVAVSVDGQLLHATLGLLEDEIAQLEAGWRDDPAPSAIVADLMRLLDPDRGAGQGDAPAQRFREVVQAVSRRLPRGVAVYPTGIIQDGSLVFATHHLQREIVELASLRPGARPLRPGTALWSYLSGAPAEPERAPLRGRFRSRGLTASQREAAELALGSRLAAVQGPPGTGKTELILSLGAHALVERIEGWNRGRSMSDGLLVVASTNNRAVDNAIDPIGCQMPDDRLPLALRCGNQELTRTITAQELGRALTWLTRQSDAGAGERLGEARAEFRRASEQLRAITSSQEARARRESRLRAIRRELASLPADPGDDADVDALREGLLALHAAITRMLRGVRARRGR